MEAEKNIQKMEKVEFLVEGIELEMEANFIRRVVMTTSKGRITYKPKTQRTEYLNGFKTIKTDSIKLDEMPDILLDINNKVKENGVCKAKGTYMLMETEMDGEKVNYRYVQGEKMMDEWELVSKVEEERV